MEGNKEYERLHRAELEDELLDKELSVSEKRARIHALEEQYGGKQGVKDILGKGVKLVAGAGRSMRINQEALQTLYGQGGGTSERIRNMSRGGFRE